MIKPGELADELIATIYAALLGETSWQHFLDGLNSMTPGALSAMFFHDLRGHTGAIAYVSGVQGREKALVQYEEYYSNLNPWMRKVAATPLGIGIIGEKIIARDEFNRSEYYNDYISQNGLETGVGLTLFRDNGCYFLLSMLTDDTDIDRNIERADILTRISPHLQRVFRYYRAGEFHAAAVDFGKGLAAASGLGFLLVNEDLTVVKSSQTGEQALASGRVIGLDPIGRVRFVSTDLQARLRAMLGRRAASRETEVFHDSFSEVRLIRIGGSAAVEFFAGPMAVILIDETATGLSPDPLRLAAKFALSPAEARVFVGIVDGLSLSEIATRAGVTRETVRSQLKSIFTKTGVSSQKDIVRLASGLRPTS